MTRPKLTLAVITEVNHLLDSFRYLIQLIVPVWESRGIEVVFVNPDSPFQSADIALLHPDLSMTPPDCEVLASRYARVLNGDVRDIRKRRISQCLFDPDNPADGPVIVKSDWNAGGRRELRARWENSRSGAFFCRAGLGPLVWPAIKSIDEMRPWRSKQSLPADRYQVYPDYGSVPPGVWANPNLVVERFLSERIGSSYSCRHWLFLGDAEVQRRTLSESPIVKGRARIERLDDSIPEELRALRGALGFDFGKFDYGVVDGNVILYDVNRSPGISRHVELHRTTAALLAEGIEAYL